MAKYRKLGRTASQRKALLRNQVTMLLQHGKIRTTEAKAKEIRKIAEGLIASAVKEKDNFEEVTIKAKVAKKDAEGKRVKEVVDGKKVTVYEEVEKTIKKDNPSRLHARRQMLKVLYPVTEVPTAAAGKKKNTKEVDLVDKLFTEIAPGSLIMIHGVSVMLWDYMNMQDMKQLMKGMDASERAVAEIYNSKTGIEVDTLRSMMTKETGFTGREALEKGFADAIKEDEDDPEMSMSADRKVLFVNGVRHNVDGLQHVPGTIPVKAIATPPAAKPGANKKKPTTKAAKKEGGNKPMDEKELRATYPEIVAQIEASARTEAQNASGEAVAAERQRIEQIDSIAASIPDQQLVHDAKYGDNPCTAQELCFRVMQASAASGQNFLAAYQAEGAKSGAADVGAAPNGGAPANAQEQDAADIQAVVSAYNQTKGGTK